MHEQYILRARRGELVRCVVAADCRHLLSMPGPVDVIGAAGCLCMAGLVDGLIATSVGAVAAQISVGLGDQLVRNCKHLPSNRLKADFGA
ncbi:MAG: hypothetical protein J2P17_22420 [Mycobacterium sp.]|nr:hypothetical protein [Mycobacterium sp.]